MSAPPLTPTSDLATLEGQIFDALTGTPLRKANILMNRSGAGHIPSGGRTTYSAKADASGHYIISGDLRYEPGTYRITATNIGYLSMDYNARRPQGSGTPVELGRGQKMTGVALKLTPHGVITGKVSDDDGDPLKSVNLQLERWVYNNGAKQLQVTGSASTNDLGAIRISGVLPGIYILSAFRRNTIPPGGAPSTSQEDYVLTYFSGATDLSATTPIEVGPGRQLDGVNLRLSKVQTVRIRGHVVNNLPNATAVRTNVADGQTTNMSIMSIKPVYGSMAHSTR